MKAYPLYYSIVQAHTYLSELQEYLQDITLKSTLDITTINGDFKIEEPEEGPDMMGILGSSFSILSAVSGPAAPAFGVLSGLVYLVDAVTPEDDDRPDPDKVLAHLADSVKSAFTIASDKIEDIRDALFGGEGTDPSKIPGEMQTQTYDSPIMRAFGDGKWLVVDPIAGLRDNMIKMGHMMVSGLSYRAILTSFRPNLRRSCWKYSRI